MRAFWLHVRTGRAFGVVGEDVGQDLDRDLPAEVRVYRAVHLAHAADADLRGNFVGSDSGASTERHVRVIVQTCTCGRLSKKGREGTSVSERCGCEPAWRLRRIRFAASIGLAMWSWKPASRTAVLIFPTRQGSERNRGSFLRGIEYRRSARPGSPPGSRGGPQSRTPPRPPGAGLFECHPNQRPRIVVVVDKEHANVTKAGDHRQTPRRVSTRWQQCDLVRAGAASRQTLRRARVI